jgi:hypothetical protein
MTEEGEQNSQSRLWSPMTEEEKQDSHTRLGSSMTEEGEQVLFSFLIHR